MYRIHLREKIKLGKRLKVLEFSYFTDVRGTILVNNLYVKGNPCVNKKRPKIEGGESKQSTGGGARL